MLRMKNRVTVTRRTNEELTAAVLANAEERKLDRLIDAEDALDALAPGQETTVHGWRVGRHGGDMFYMVVRKQGGRKFYNADVVRADAADLIAGIKKLMLTKRARTYRVVDA